MTALDADFRPSASLPAEALLGPAPQCRSDNVFFSGHGFGIGPGAGHLIADLATGAEPIVDPVPYRPERFNNSAWSKVAEF